MYCTCSKYVYLVGVTFAVAGALRSLSTANPRALARQHPGVGPGAETLHSLQLRPVAERGLVDHGLGFVHFDADGFRQPKGQHSEVVWLWGIGRLRAGGTPNLVVVSLRRSLRGYAWRHMGTLWWRNVGNCHRGASNYWAD